MNEVSYILTDNSITVNYAGETHIIRRSDKLADDLILALKDNRLKDIPSLVSAAKRLEKYSHGTFLVKNGRVEINGVPAPEVLSNKILRFSDEGLPYQPLVKFAEKLQANPSFRAVNELYSFLEKNDHPLTQNGCFIAYKRVKEDFKDIYTGSFDNSVGNVVEVARNQVDEDCNRTCSNGLHVANWDYAHTVYGSNNSNTDVMLEVEVDPSDVVAVPIDYNNAKMRVCKYKVLGVVQNAYEPETSLRITDPDYDCRCRELECKGNCEYCKCCGQDVNECKVEEDCCEYCGEADCYGDCDEESFCEYCGEDYCMGECEDTCLDCGSCIDECVCEDIKVEAEKYKESDDE